MAYMFRHHQLAHVFPAAAVAATAAACQTTALLVLCQIAGQSWLGQAQKFIYTPTTCPAVEQAPCRYVMEVQSSKAVSRGAHM
eukprot:1153450-Pelagomonas_calceolata.AAC.4